MVMLTSRGVEGWGKGAEKRDENDFLLDIFFVYVDYMFYCRPKPELD